MATKSFLDLLQLEKTFLIKLKQSKRINGICYKSILLLIFAFERDDTQIFHHFRSLTCGVVVYLVVRWVDKRDLRLKLNFSNILVNIQICRSETALPYFFLLKNFVFLEKKFFFFFFFTLATFLKETPERWRSFTSFVRN